MVSSSFVFIDNLEPELVRHAMLIDVPARISDKGTLLSIYKKSGQFPDHFGFNWDSLQDCLCDFSWCDSSLMLISHADLPLIDDKNELAIYLRILHDSVVSFQVARAHSVGLARAKILERRLLVRFPAALLNPVEALLAVG